MSTTVHVFFNGSGVILPEQNEWDKFGEVDSLRMFLVCAESWQRFGWEVKRLATIAGDFEPTPFLPGGRVEREYHWYAAELWQFIAKAKTVAVPGLNVFCTMDVINFGLIPAATRLLDLDAFGCYSFQNDHFSLSCFACSPEWLDMAENVLIRYDREELGLIQSPYVSDETILRRYLPGKGTHWQKFACNPGAERLVHFARSSLARIYHALPRS